MQRAKFAMPRSRTHRTPHKSQREPAQLAYYWSECLQHAVNCGCLYTTHALLRLLPHRSATQSSLSLNRPALSDGLFGTGTGTVRLSAAAAGGA